MWLDPIPGIVVHDLVVTSGGCIEGDVVDETPSDGDGDGDGDELASEGTGPPLPVCWNVFTAAVCALEFFPD
jgi:hypothetical protein